MAYELTGISRYKVKELNHNSQILIVKESFAILTKSGESIAKQIALDLLRNPTTYYDDMRTLQNAYLRVKMTYTQCVHVSAIRRFTRNKPIVVDV